MQNEQYKCNPAHWDAVARREPIAEAGIPERYTQNQCITAFRIGLSHLKQAHIKMLKTDLWTEGVVRSREVLNHAIAQAGKQGYTVQAHGIDISPEICNQAIFKGTKAQIKQGDIRRLQYPPGFFDMILDMSTIDHVPFNEAGLVLLEYKRCLRPGGILVLMFAHEGSTLDKVRPPGGIKDYYTFPVDELKRRMSGSFVPKQEYAVHFLNIPPAASAFIRSGPLHAQGHLVRLFEFFEYTPLSKYFRRFAPMYVIVAERTA